MSERERHSFLSNEVLKFFKETLSIQKSMRFFSVGPIWECHRPHLGVLKMPFDNAKDAVWHSKRPFFSTPKRGFKHSKIPFPLHAQRIWRINIWYSIIYDCTRIKVVFLCKQVLFYKTGLFQGLSEIKMKGKHTLFRRICLSCYINVSSTNYINAVSH